MEEAAAAVAGAHAGTGRPLFCWSNPSSTGDLCFPNTRSFRLSCEQISGFRSQNTLFNQLFIGKIILTDLVVQIEKIPVTGSGLWEEIRVLSGVECLQLKHTLMGLRSDW